MFISFFIFVLLFSGVGLLAAFKQKRSVEDYFLASRTTPSWLIALSTGATTSSGATFIGFAGLAYFSGVAAFYASFGILLGEYCAWRLAQDKLRALSAQKSINTYPRLIAHMGHPPMVRVQKFIAVLSVFFLGVYCSAQLIAAAKVGAYLFDWSYTAFIVLGGVVLLGYSWAGGVRASIWSDACQALLMIASLLVLIGAVYIHLGGNIGGITHALSKVEVGYLNPFQLKYILLFVGWVGFGFSILGQSHVMVRHMAARSKNSLKKAMPLALGWRFCSLFLASVAGIGARLVLPETQGFDPELSMPQLWQSLLSPALVGLLMAGLFAATLSSADSLLLSACAAFTQNMLPQRLGYKAVRWGTLFMVMLAVNVALYADKGVLSLVVLVWGGMASALTPIVGVYLLGGKLTQKCTLMMMVAGLSTMLFWRYVLELHTVLMDFVPGMAAGFLVYGVKVALPAFNKKDIVQK